MYKLRILFFFFIFFFIGILIKLFYIQVIDPNAFKTDDYLKTRKTMPERGRILDRNNQPLVLNQDNYQLFLEPKKMVDREQLIESLNKALSIDKASLEAKIDETKQWLALKSNLSRDKKTEVESFKIKGIGFEESFKRYYPESSLAAHLLGFVGKNTEGKDVGYFGIEGFYNQDLAGLPGFFKTERDLLGRPIFIGTQEKIEPENGRDLTLTIDRSIQAITKNKLMEGLEKYDAKEGCIIVADPKNLQILSLVCLPDFDLDQYYLFSEAYFKNPSISDLYEPGSTFKPLIMAAALEEKAVKPDEIYNEEGPITIGEYTIRTWNNKYEGKISMTRILEKSSNVGMVYVGQKLGEEKLYRYLKKYGFGEKTGVDLQGEASGFIKHKETWYPIDYATVSFGQGIAITPIQMLRAFTVLINGGNLFKPYVVKAMQNEGNKKEVEPKLKGKIISKKTSEIIKEMLIAAVENGEVKWAKPKNMSVGGKTGTAQIPIAGHYDPTKTITSFIGFAPAQNPRFIALVVLKEPKSSQWGAETAGPLFFNLAKELYIYYNIGQN